MAQKTYHYRDDLYKRQVKFTGAFGGVVAVFAAIAFFFSNTNFLYVPIIIVGIYTYWETYISCSNPQDVTIDDRAITFSGCGKVQTYLWKDIKSFRLKEFYGARELFLRINEAGIKSGRYWIRCNCMNDTEELFNFFLNKEVEIHPNTVKARARRAGQDNLNK